MFSLISSEKLAFPAAFRIAPFADLSLARVNRGIQIARTAVFLLLSLSVCTALLPAANAQSITVPNFGFETPSLGSEFQYGPSGGSWIFEGPGIAGNGSAFTVSNGPAPEGTQVAFLQNSGGFHQLLSGFSSGASYTITFQAAERNYDVFAGQTWKITVDGNEIANFAPAPNATAYTGYSAQFQATSTSHTIAFVGTNLRSSVGHTDNTVFIDDVKIDQIAPPAPPVAPGTLTAVAVSAAQVSLFWSDNASNETGYKIERKISGGAYSQIGTAGVNAVGYQDAGVSQSTSYIYRVRATNAIGDSVYSNEASAATGLPETGLRGDYYSNTALVAPATLSRTDATVDFTWNGVSPGSPVPTTYFSVLWRGKVQPMYSETYTFYASTDDGVRLTVDGVPLIDNWVGQANTEKSGTIHLTAGEKYDIRMEYFQGEEGAEAHLSWSSLSTPKAIIPQSQLYPSTSAPQPPAGLYQIETGYYDGYGSNYASTYVHVAAPVPGNRAPVLGAITASPSTVSPSGTVNLSIAASDPDGDPLQYFWVVPAGEIGWSKAATETWIAPTVGATYTLQVMVGDGKTWVSKYVDVTVNGNGTIVPAGLGNHVVAMTSVKASATTIAPGETVTLSATHFDIDPGPEEGSQHWHASGGTIGGDDTNGTWTAPASPGLSVGGRQITPGLNTWKRLPPDLATCPIPLSTSIIGIGLTGRASRQHYADTFMPSWGSDGDLFTPWQDGILLTPPYGDNLQNHSGNLKNGWARMVGNDPQDLMTTTAGLLDRVPSPQDGQSCYPGAVFSKDGIWYYGVRYYQNYDRNGNPSSDPDQRFRITVAPFIGFHTSTDGGLNWVRTSHGASNPLFPETDPEHVKFGQLFMVDFGKNQQYSPDGKVYFVSIGSSSDDPSVDNLNDDNVYLCRVTPSLATINDGSQYEFYAGNGTWTHDVNAGQPIVTWSNHFSGATVVYNPGLNKFIMTCYMGHYSMNGNQTVWEDDDDFVMESSNIEGPYSMVMYWSSFGTEGYYPNIPSKFLSGDGRTAWIWYSANFSPSLIPNSRPEDPVGSGYRCVQQQIRFLLPGDLPEAGAGAFAFTAPSASRQKNAGPVTLSVSRTSGSTGPVSVHYSTANGTAAAGTDYTAASDTLIWAEGDSSVKTISVPLLNPATVGPSKTFSVALSNPSNGVLDTPSNITVTVTEPPFNDWLYTRLGATANDPVRGGRAGDSDSDGINNFLEYALGGDLALPSRAILPSTGTETVGGVDYLTLTYKRDTSLTDVAYLVESSPDLSVWSPVSDVLVSTAGTVETRKASVAIAGGKIFLHLKVTAQ